MRIYGVTGWKNAGKTGMVERLVAEISQRGFTISTLKHAHHDTDVDQPGRDSYRHRAAGAQQVMLSSPNRWALMTELRDQPEPTLADLLPLMTPVDLILVEGYKREPHPKIEAHRWETGRPLLVDSNPTIRAVASNTVPQNLRVPSFDLDDIPAIADFILAEVGL